MEMFKPLLRQGAGSLSAQSKRGRPRKRSSGRVPGRAPDLKDHPWRHRWIRQSSRPELPDELGTPASRGNLDCRARRGCVPECVLAPVTAPSHARSPKPLRCHSKPRTAAALTIRLSRALPLATALATWMATASPTKAPRTFSRPLLASAPSRIADPGTLLGSGVADPMDAGDLAGDSRRRDPARSVPCSPARRRSGYGCPAGRANRAARCGRGWRRATGNPYGGRRNPRRICHVGRSSL